VLKNTPAEIIDKLDREINAGLADPHDEGTEYDSGSGNGPFGFGWSLDHNLGVYVNAGIGERLVKSKMNLCCVRLETSRNNETVELCTIFGELLGVRGHSRT